jgi:PKD repeat protein
MQAEVRPAGGAFGTIINNVSAQNFVITRPNVAFAPNGRAIANWLSPGGLFYEVQSAILDNGATSFGAPIVAQSVVGAFGETIDGATPIAVDNQGNAVTTWRRKFDNSPDPGLQPAFRIEVARLDAVAPAFTSVSIPNSGRIGTPVQVSAAATDRLSDVTLTWSFGDGGTATGGTASHTYTRGGTFTIAVTATDAVGNASVATDTIVVPGSGAGAGGGAGNGLVAGLDVTGLRLSRKVFRAATRGGSVKPSAAAAKSWTRVTYKVSTAARVRFSFERPRSGRRVGARCVTQTAGNRSHKSCIRYIAVKGSFSRQRPKGGDRFTFTGRLLGHRLARGRYRIVATPFNAAGGHGTSGRAAFRIR